MNVIFHFLLSYLAANAIFGNASSYLVYIIIFSVLMDFDHIPYIIRAKKDLVHKRFGSESRSRFHEIYGLMLVSLAISAFSVFIDINMVKVIALSLILHYIIDFLTGKTRPFYPLSEKEVFMGIYPQRHRIFSETVLTLISGVALWLVMTS